MWWWVLLGSRWSGVVVHHGCWWGLGGRVWWCTMGVGGFSVVGCGGAPWVLVGSRWSGVVMGVGGVLGDGCGGDGGAGDYNFRIIKHMLL